MAVCHRRLWALPALALFLGHTAFAAEIKGTVFDSRSPPQKITNGVVVQVFDVAVQGGELLRQDGVLVTVGEPIDSKLSDDKGAFTVVVPPRTKLPGEVRPVVLTFRRANAPDDANSVTQRIDGFVVDPNRAMPYVLDLTVPEPLPQPAAVPCPPSYLVVYRQPTFLCQPQRRRLFHR